MSKYPRTSVLGIGSTGDGPYSPTHDTIVYNQWFNMLSRCYDLRTQHKHKSYEGCTVCEEWLIFQNFADFHYSDVYRQTHWHLDKDLLVKNNKIYGPEFCIYVPAEINKMLVRRQRHRGNTPIGVHYEEKRLRYKASMHDGNGKTKFLGRYLTIDEAFKAYKQAKENHIKIIAEQYKPIISPRLYAALINYTVDIDD